MKNMYNINAKDFWKLQRLGMVKKSSTIEPSVRPWPDQNHDFLLSFHFLGTQGFIYSKLNLNSCDVVVNDLELIILLLSVSVALGFRCVPS